MQVSLGALALDPNAATLVMRWEPVRNEGQIVYKIKKSWAITVILQADDQAGLEVAIAGLRAACVDGINATWADNAGNAADQLLSAGALGGTKVEGPNFP